MNYPVDPKTNKYNHAEAFCLMYYRSEQGLASKEFWVWNSRDGVTPFCIIEDGIEYQHDKWYLDKCVPDFQLPDGHRFFRDTTPAEAAYIALKRIQLYNGKYFTGPESERLLPDTKLWYETWARVTESFIGKPIVDKYEALPALLEKAKTEGLWFYSSALNLWSTPAEMESGRFNYEADSWSVIHPEKQWKALKIQMHNTTVDLNKWEEKMRVNGLKVPDSFLS